MLTISDRRKAVWHTHFSSLVDTIQQALIRTQKHIESKVNRPRSHLREFIKNIMRVPNTSLLLVASAGGVAGFTSEAPMPLTAKRWGMPKANLHEPPQPQHARESSWHRVHHQVSPPASSLANDDRPSPSAVETVSRHHRSSNDNDDDSTDASDGAAVRAQLKYVGPYPTLPLRFPRLATSSQRSRNVTGVALDFIVDTAANTNTLNRQVATELRLPVVGSASPGVSAGGAITGGDTYLLGDCELDGLPAEGKFTFMTGLTASVLPVPSPAAGGLLGVPFLNCFRGGVEFAWNGNETYPPSVTFFGTTDVARDTIRGMDRIPIRQLPGSYLPSLTLQINGVNVPALLDTGSPVTVLNANAAKLTSVSTVQLEGETTNPFARMARGFRTAQAAAKGDVLLLAGNNGQPIELLKSEEPVCVSAVNDETDKTVSVLGRSHIYVGDLPGLAALGGLGGKSAPPAAVLGMDVLRLRPKMVYRPNEVYF